MRLSWFIVALVAIWVVFAQEEGSVLQIGNYFPNGIRLGTSSGPCTAAMEYTLMFRNGRLGWCQGETWVDMKAHVICSSHGEPHDDKSCTCFDDDVRGHYQGESCTLCSPGWTSNPAGECIVDVDECLEENANNCHADAVCKNTPGSYECECNNGYFGDGMTCADINECDVGHNCSTHALCDNSPPGSFTCSCKEGFEGDGWTCEDVDECTAGTHSCIAEATFEGVPQCRYPTSCHEAAEKGLFHSNQSALIDFDGNDGPIAPELIQCEMDHDGGGWTVVGEIVASDACPSEFNRINVNFPTEPTYLCTRRNIHPVWPGGGCDGVSYTLKGRVTSISGTLRGYQRGSMDAWGQYGEQNDKSINGPYVDGFAITTGYPTSTEHVWAYAIGGTIAYSHFNNCPCHGGPGPPSFVGSNYYCNSGDPSTVVSSYYSRQLYSAQCTSSSKCCSDSSKSSSEPSIFRRDYGSPLDAATLDFRICSNQEIANEDGGVEQAIFYSRDGTADPSKPTSCGQIFERGGIANGYYQIYNEVLGHWDSTYCAQDEYNEGWEYIQENLYVAVNVAMKIYATNSVMENESTCRSSASWVSSWYNLPNQCLLDVQCTDTGTRVA